MKEENMKEVLEKIKRTAEIILEQHMSRPLRNTIITVGIESIISMAKEAIDEIEKGDEEGKGDDKA